MSISAIGSSTSTSTTQSLTEILACYKLFRSYSINLQQFKRPYHELSKKWLSIPDASPNKRQ